MNKLYKPFQWLWLGWLLLFAVIEVAALLLSRGLKPAENYEGGTFSELVWRTTRKDRNLVFRGVALSAFLALFAVLGYHFFLQA